MPNSCVEGDEAPAKEVVEGTPPPLPEVSSSPSSPGPVESTVTVSESPRPTKEPNDLQEEQEPEEGETNWTSPPLSTDGRSSAVKADPGSPVNSAEEDVSLAEAQLLQQQQQHHHHAAPEEAEEVECTTENLTATFEEEDPSHWDGHPSDIIKPTIAYEYTTHHLSCFPENGMQTAYPPLSSDSSPYAMQSANAATALGAANFYSPGAYGLMASSQSYNSGSRSISQPCKGSSSLAPSAFANFGPYPHFGGPSTQSTPSSYCTYGPAYSPNYGASVGASSSPPSQNFASCQQAVDYTSAYGYSQSSAYSSYYGHNAYPYLTSAGSGSTNPNHTTANGTPLALTSSSASSSPTYQLPPQLPSAETNSHYHQNLDNTTTPPLKPSPLELPANGALNHLNVTNKKGKSGRGRGRRVANTSPPPEQTLDRVFIWDLDETIIHQHSLITGTYATMFSKDQNELLKLGLEIERLGFEISDYHFFCNDLENCDQVHIDEVSADDTGQDLTNYNFESDGFPESAGNSGLSIPSTGVRGGVDWMRKLAFRYRKIKENYNACKDNVGALLGEKHAHWLRLREEIESVTDGWYTVARKCLAIVNQREKSANILVSENQLVLAISKLIVNDLGQFFQIENVYSSAKVGKDHIFERIKQKYGNKCTYVVIGDNCDEENAAKKLSMPFWRISCHSDLHNLQRAMSLEII